MKEYRKKCKVCGKEFISKSSRGEYCSEECKKAKIPTSEHLGEKWGELTILSAYRIVGRLYAECECSCGKPCTVRYDMHNRSVMGMTQRELAEKSGVNIRQIQKYESGEYDTGNMTLKNALAIAGALECEVKDLL